MTTPAVAPFQSCTRCLAGDTATGIVVRGEAEFVIAVLTNLGAMTFAEAKGAYGQIALDLGCDPGNVPSGRQDHAIRLCASCADLAGVSVAPLTDRKLPCIVQPEDAAT